MSRASTAYTLEDILTMLREQYEVWEAVRREILPASLLEMHSNIRRMADILQDMAILQWEPPTNPDSGFITYWIARQTAEWRYGAIAFEMGLEPNRLLTYGDVFRLTMHESTSEYDGSQLDQTQRVNGDRSRQSHRRRVLRSHRSLGYYTL